MAPSSSNSNRSGKDHETLREKAAKKLHGPDANPSQLGDPISLKAETSETIPKPEEGGAHHGSASGKDGSPYAPPLAPPPSHDVNWDSNNPEKQRELENKKKLEYNKADKTADGEGMGKGKDRGAGGGETLREKAAKKVKGPGANPSQLGDPVSLKNEISEKAPTPTEEGASGGNKKGRESKL